MERVGDAQVQLKRALRRDIDGERLSNDVVGEALGERIPWRRPEQAERLDGFEAPEAGVDVQVGGAGEQTEVDVATDERRQLQQLSRVVVESRRQILHDVPDRRGHAVPDRPSVECAGAGEQPGQFPDEERVAVRPLVDAACDGCGRRASGLETDQFGHLVN